MQAVDTFSVHRNLAAWSADTAAGFALFFSFEYAILACMLFAAAVKYVLTMIDTTLGHQWPAKGLYSLYLELFIDVVHFVLYTAFFACVMHAFQTFPFHIVFDVFSAWRALFNSASNYLRYRTVISQINTLADATAEDIERVGGTCIICRDELQLADGVKKLSCGHVFHLSCLQSWLERQQTCPICRTRIFPAAAPAAAAAAAEPAAAGPAPAPAAAGAAAPAAPAARAAPAAAPAAVRPAAAAADGAQAGVPRVGIRVPQGAVRHRYVARNVGAARAGGGVAGGSAAGGAGATGGFVPVGQDGGGYPAMPHPGFGSGVVVRPLPPPLRTLLPFDVELLCTVPPRMQAMPANATQEQRAAYAAAAAAYSSVVPFMAPLYHPYGIPPPMPGILPPMPGVPPAATSPATTPAGSASAHAATPGTLQPSVAATAVPVAVERAAAAAVPVNFGAAPPGPAWPPAASTAAPAPGPTTTGGAQQTMEERAALAAHAAIAASVAAAKHMLQGQVTVLQQQMGALDAVAQSARQQATQRAPATAPQGPATEEAAGSADTTSSGAASGSGTAAGSGAGVAAPEGTAA